MKNYQKINNITGWIVFTIASVVYLLTMERTASFWDCGEFISTAYKLQVGHPPGAPLYQMLGRIFSLFAFGDVTKVGLMVNAMSAISSGFTILFLYWSITILAKKVVTKSGSADTMKMYAIFGSAFVGAMAYTFSDTFWFSAVEAEVYAMSSFLTAFVFWAMLKWESQADRPDALRWIVLIAYVMGLSIGVHLLNLLTIPAIVFIYYFKKYPVTPKSFVIALAVAVGLLAVVQNGVIPWVIQLDWLFERFFVNSIGLPFHTGTIIYFLTLTIAIVYGLKYTHRKRKILANTIILCFTFIVIGYSSFFMLVIRSNANVPINENAPVDALGLMAYLGREQYGDWPILYGPYYNAPVVGRQDGKPVYRKNEEQGRYVLVDERKDVLPVYDDRFKTIFPRMHGTRADQISAYKEWGKIRGIPIEVRQHGGEREVRYRPTFTENLRFFFRYQVSHMYWRYFMWNFAGRQNDIQGHGSLLEGNWISGINFLDEMRLGPQTNLPDFLESNKARNKYYLLPLILGIIGFLYHVKKNYKDALVVTLLFFMTGLAIILYLNQTPYQPRERDYAYAASFYAFAIWIAFGVISIIEKLRQYMSAKMATALTVIISTLLVPVIMAKENWDDHDRSKRTTARDMALNYLESCAPNAIIFTHGDNDTFPLWYLQEVEGIRTDVKVCNLSLLSADWYIDNMMRRKFYEADPIPMSLTPDKYIAHTRDVVYILEDERITEHVELRELVDFASKDENRHRVQAGFIDYLPTRKLKLSVDSATVVNNGTVAPENAHKIVPALEWTISGGFITKNHFILMDLLASNNWERPLYFASSVGPDHFIGLQNYFQLEGMAYRLVPIKTETRGGQTGRIDTDILYDNLMNKFSFGNLKHPRVHQMQDNSRVAFIILRNTFSRLAHALVDENKNDSAIAVIDKCLKEIPSSAVPHNLYSLPLAEAYYRAGATDKGNDFSKKILTMATQELEYYFSFKPRFAAQLDNEKQLALSAVQRVFQIAERHNQTALAEEAKEIFDSFFNVYQGQR